MSKGRKKPVPPKLSTLLESLQRKRGERDLNKRFLIVCEDGESARNYFEALKKHENLSAASITVVGNDGGPQPIKVVAAAIKRKNAAAKKNTGTVAFDQVWCVIDGDYGAAINNARAKAKARGIELAVSTMCFEYWILLHFAEDDTPTADCDSTVRALKKEHCPHYSKGTCDYSGIVPNARTACARAKKLRRKDELPEKQSPCSDVYLLIEAILDAKPPAGSDNDMRSQSRRRS